MSFNGPHSVAEHMLLEPNGKTAEYHHWDGQEEDQHDIKVTVERVKSRQEIENLAFLHLQADPPSNLANYEIGSSQETFIIDASESIAHPTHANNEATKSLTQAKCDADISQRKIERKSAKTPYGGILGIPLSPTSSNKMPHGSPYGGFKRLNTLSRNSYSATPGPVRKEKSRAFILGPEEDVPAPKRQKVEEGGEPRREGSPDKAGNSASNKRRRTSSNSQVSQGWKSAHSTAQGNGHLLSGPASSSLSKPSHTRHYQECRSKRVKRHSETSASNVANPQVRRPIVRTIALTGDEDDPIEDDGPTIQSKPSTEQTLRLTAKKILSINDSRRDSIDPLQSDQIKSATSTAATNSRVKADPPPFTKHSSDEDSDADELAPQSSDVMKPFAKSLSTTGNIKSTQFKKKGTLTTARRQSTKVGEYDYRGRKFPVFGVICSAFRYQAGRGEVGDYEFDSEADLFKLYDDAGELVRHGDGLLDVRPHTILRCSRCPGHQKLHILRPSQTGKPANKDIFIEFSQAKVMAQFEMVIARLSPACSFIDVDIAHMDSRFRRAISIHQEEKQRLKRQPASAVKDSVLQANDVNDPINHHNSAKASTNTSNTKSTIVRSMQPQNTSANGLVKFGEHVPTPRRTRRSAPGDYSQEETLDLPEATRQRKPVSENKKHNPVAETPWSTLHTNYIDQWPTPLYWPPGKKRRATVDPADITKLDDDEFLNDGIVEFYIRLCEEIAVSKQPGDKPAKKIHRMSSFWFSKLVGEHKGDDINYDAIKRWNRNVDMFECDYIIVPINENLHWYGAIICNPGALLRSVEDAEDSSQPNHEVGAASHNKTTIKEEISPSSHHDVRNENGSPSSEKESEDVDVSMKDLSITEALPEVASSRDEAIQPDVDSQNAPAEPQNVRSTADSEGNDTKLFSQKKHKRRSGAHLKMKEGEPKIICLDSLGTRHPMTIRKLRAWLTAEAKEKRGQDIAHELKGLGANASHLPQQSNFSDCGIFLLGYIEQFYDDPDSFIQQIMTTMVGKSKASFMGKIDAKQARVTIRTLLLKLRKEQLVEEQKARREKAKSRLRDDILEISSNDEDQEPVEWWNTRITTYSANEWISFQSDQPEQKDPKPNLLQSIKSKFPNKPSSLGKDEGERSKFFVSVELTEHKPDGGRVLAVPDDTEEEETLDGIYAGTDPAITKVPANHPAEQTRSHGKEEQNSNSPFSLETATSNAISAEERPDDDEDEVQEVVGYQKANYRKQSRYPPPRIMEKGHNAQLKNDSIEIAAEAEQLSSIEDEQEGFVDLIQTSLAESDPRNVQLERSSTQRSISPPPSRKLSDRRPTPFPSLKSSPSAGDQSDIDEQIRSESTSPREQRVKRRSREFDKRTLSSPTDRRRRGSKVVTPGDKGGQEVIQLD